MHINGVRDDTILISDRETYEFYTNTDRIQLFLLFIPDHVTVLEFKVKRTGIITIHIRDYKTMGLLI